eukprot:GHVR01093157.1.p1 GENE.GHVR01093157.1~~GHVR01093157.1.p1  ORF type:complete len:218 (+),score=75.34 GHVR01093157.1:592-1245(+)
MQESAVKFNRGAQEVRTHFWWQNKKFWILVVGGIVVLVFVVWLFSYLFGGKSSAALQNIFDFSSDDGTRPVAANVDTQSVEKDETDYIFKNEGENYSKGMGKKLGGGSSSEVDTMTYDINNKKNNNYYDDKKNNNRENKLEDDDDDSESDDDSDVMPIDESQKDGRRGGVLSSRHASRRLRGSNNESESASMIGNEAELTGEAALKNVIQKEYVVIS